MNMPESRLVTPESRLSHAFSHGAYSLGKSRVVSLTVPPFRGTGVTTLPHARKEGGVDVPCLSAHSRLVVSSGCAAASRRQVRAGYHADGGAWLHPTAGPAMAPRLSPSVGLARRNGPTLLLTQQTGGIGRQLGRRNLTGEKTVVDHA